MTELLAILVPVALAFVGALALSGRRTRPAPPRAPVVIGEGEATRTEAAREEHRAAVVELEDRPTLSDDDRARAAAAAVLRRRG